MKEVRLEQWQFGIFSTSRKLTSAGGQRMSQQPTVALQLGVLKWQGTLFKDISTIFN